MVEPTIAAKSSEMLPSVAVEIRSDIPEFQTRPIADEDCVDQRERSRVGIRPVHHAVARLLAWGCKIRVAARMTGYSESGVRGMMQRPEFQALLKRYQGQVNLSGLDLKERIQLGAQEARRTRS
jgi:hypothetical protein